MNHPRLLCLLLICSVLSTSAAALIEKPAIIDAAKYPSLQAAFDALPTNGGVVHLPPGTFELTTPLMLMRGETRIEGSGAATHLINKNTNGQPALLIAPPNIKQNNKARIWRVQVGNFRLSGNTNSGDGLYAEGVQEIFIHGLSVDHHGGHGINLTNCYEDPRVSDSILTYNRKAGLNILSCHDIVVNGNHFEENQDALRCIDSFNLTMNGNNIDDHLRHGVVIENTYGSVLSGNMIEECAGTAVILDRDAYGITISANVIAHETGGGVHLLDAWGCSISANTFVLVHSNAIFISTNSGRHTITGNQFCNSEIGGKKKRLDLNHTNLWARDEATGIVLDGTSDIVISGNSFSGLIGEAVLAKGRCERLSIMGNIVTDCGRRFTRPKDLINVRNARRSVVKDNIVR